LFKFKEGENFKCRNTLSISRLKILGLTPKLGKRGRFAKVSLWRGYKKPRLFCD